MIRRLSSNSIAKLNLISNFNTMMLLAPRNTAKNFIAKNIYLILTTPCEKRHLIRTNGGISNPIIVSSI